MIDLQALQVSLSLAAATTFVLWFVAAPLSYWLARTRSPWRKAVEIVATLPLVLPPTVLGFYVLILSGPFSPLGKLLENLGLGRLPFTFTGVLVASVLYNLPFAVRPFTTAFRGVDRQLEEAAWCLGASRLSTFFRVTLPVARPGLTAGCVLVFAHTLGEFGVVLMMGGNIPGVTRTLSIALYDQVQALDYAAAHVTAGVLVAMSVLSLAVAAWLGGREEVW